MKTEKIIASVIATALGITSIIPMRLSAANTADFIKPVFNADDDYSLGDVNNDKSVDASDASIILAEYALIATGKNSSFSEEQKKSADIDTNGLIDSADAALVLSYYAYYSTGGKLDMASFLAQQGNPPTTATTTVPKTTSTVKTTTNTTAKITTKTTANTTAVPKTTSKPTVTTKATTSTSKSTSTITSTATTISTITSTAVTSTTVNPSKVSSIKLDRTEVYIGVGYGYLSANVTMLPDTAPNKNEIWTSSDENIAVVDHEGYVIGKSKGTCIITVTSDDNPEVSEKITVHIVDPSTVCNISLTQNELSIKKGYEGYAAIVTMYPITARDKREKWSSSNEEIATVNEEGWFVAKKAGTCAITVQSVNNPAVLATIIINVYDDEPPVTTTTSATTATSTTASTTTGQSTTATSTVTTDVQVNEISLSKYEMTIPIGKKDISMVTMLPYDAVNKDEIWISSDETIATVDKYGWIKGVSVGECTVTVYSVSNPEVKAEIAVKIVDANDDVPEPNINFSYVIGEKSDKDNLAFCTPLPKNASGSFVIDYKITNSDGKITTISRLIEPKANSVITMLTAATPTFTVDTYITNLDTNECAKIGKYKLCLNPRNAETLEEDIHYAFYIISGISE